MAQNSYLETRPCVVWETLLPARRIGNGENFLSRSFIFSVLGRHCYLTLESTCMPENGFRYELSIVCEGAQSNSSNTDVCAMDRLNVTLISVTNSCAYTVFTLSFPFEKRLLKVLQQTSTGENATVKIFCIFHGNKGLPVEGGIAIVNLKSLSSDFTKMLKHEILPDQSLNCKDGSVSAHRFVLSARSKVFASKLQNERGQIDVTEFDSRVVKMFLEFLYSGKFSPDDYSYNDVVDLYRIANELAVGDLKVTCRDRLIGDFLCKSNCTHLLIVAHLCKDTIFKKAVISYISNQPDILQSSEWLQFSRENTLLGVEVYESYVYDLTYTRIETAREKIKQNYPTVPKEKAAFLIKLGKILAKKKCTG